MSNTTNSCNLLNVNSNADQENEKIQQNSTIENLFLTSEGECLEDLEYKGLKIIQSKAGYRFTSDSVLLAAQVDAKASSRVVDLGTGSSVIATLIAARTGAEVVGIEIQASLALRAARTVALNGMQDTVRIVNSDFRTAHKTLGAGKFDIAVCNPPYFPKEVKEAYTERDGCKTEVLSTLTEIVQSAKRLLAYGGKFYFIYKADRLIDAIVAMRAEGIEPKVLRPVLPKANQNADTVIITAVKGGKPGLKLETPLIVYEQNGEMTAETKRIYHK